MPEASFGGSVPENYDQLLVPLFFEDYADELARRLQGQSGGSVLEIACGTGVVTRKLREYLAPDVALFATDMDERGALAGGGLVATVMSNLGLEKALEARGLNLIRTAVGDRYVVEAMRAGKYNLGGEQSGHIVFLDHNTTAAS